MFVSGMAQVGSVNGKDLNRFGNEAVFIDVPANITGQKKCNQIRYTILEIRQYL